MIVLILIFFLLTLKELDILILIIWNFFHIEGINK
jgi:hypothetical protein